MVYESLGLAYYSQNYIDKASPEAAKKLLAVDKAIENADLDNTIVSVMLKKQVLDMVYGPPERNQLPAAVTRRIRNKYLPVGQLKSDPVAKKANLVLTAGSQPILTYKSPDALALFDTTARPVPADFQLPTQTAAHLYTVQYLKAMAPVDYTPPGKPANNIPAYTGPAYTGTVPTSYDRKYAIPVYDAPSQPDYIMPIALAAGAGLLAFLALR